MRFASGINEVFHRYKLRPGTPALKPVEQPVAVERIEAICCL